MNLKPAQSLYWKRGQSGSLPGFPSVELEMDGVIGITLFFDVNDDFEFFLADIVNRRGESVIESEDWQTLFECDAFQNRQLASLQLEIEARQQTAAGF